MVKRLTSEMVPFPCRCPKDGRPTRDPTLARKLFRKLDFPPESGALQKSGQTILGGL
jgi:hypothetical protein